MPIPFDVRYAVRSLRRSPLLTGAAIVSLTLGIATATVVFSLIDAAILRDPPFSESRRLVLLSILHRSPESGEGRRRWSWPSFRILERSASAFEGIASLSNTVATLTGVDDPEPVPVEEVSARYLTVVRAPLVLGGGFDRSADDDDRAAPAIVLGYDLWQRRYGGSTAVLGRTVELNNVALTVVGVAARGFAGISGVAKAWIPARIAPAISYSGYLTTNQSFITVVARLRDGVSLDAARAELRILGPQIQIAHPSEGTAPNTEFSAGLTTLSDARVDTVTRRALLLLGGAVFVLLLVACANVATLLLGRAAAQRREIATRLAFGATRGRLIRQLLTESLLLAVPAGAVALVLASWSTDLLRIPATLSRGRSFVGSVGEFATPALDWRVLAFVMAVCGLTVVCFGLVPAFKATRAELVADLKAGTSGGRVGRFGLQQSVVALQVALSLILLVACGLLLTSYTRLRDTRLGFDPEHLLTFMLRPSEVRYTPATAPALLDRVLSDIRAVPGVVAATVDGCAPLTVQCANADLHIVGREWNTPSDAPEVLRHYVAPDHFKTLGVRVIRGRSLMPEDRAGRPHVVVINETAARRYWPNENPIGKRVWWDATATFASPDSAAEIVGVVADMAYQPLDGGAVQPDFFTAYAQFTFPTRMVLVRTAGDPLAIVTSVARAVRRADPNLALFDVQSMDTRVNGSWEKHTFQTALFLIIGGIALFLSITGVYAVTSYFVTRQMREIGVRLALGASNLHIASVSMSQTVRLGAIGGVVGLAGAFAVSRALRALLYETSPLDPSVFVGAPIVLLLALGVATWVPVRRAMTANPTDVLKSE